MNPQTLHVKDATGLKKTISAGKPFPVWVAGMDELPEQIARHIGTHILKPPDVNVTTPDITVESPPITVMAPTVHVAVDLSTLENYAKIGLYWLAAMSGLLAGLILLLIFVR